MSMETMEHTQTIIWVLEGVTFFTVAVIAWFVWRISRRASNAKKAEQAD